MAAPKPAAAPKPQAAPTIPGGDITQLELTEIERKLADHAGDRNSLSTSELDALHKHERFVRLKRVVAGQLEAAAQASALPKRNAAAFKARLAGLVSTRNKAGITALIRDLENAQRLRDGHAAKSSSYIAAEIELHEKRIAKLRESQKRSSIDVLAIKERIDTAKAALASIDDAFKCPNCGVRLPSQRNLDQHMLKCKPKVKK